MLITLTEWAGRKFSHPPHINTLRQWAKNGQINPPPVKVARRYCVPETAEFIPLVGAGVDSIDSVMMEILSDGKTS